MLIIFYLSAYIAYTLKANQVHSAISFTVADTALLLVVTSELVYNPD